MNSDISGLAVRSYLRGETHRFANTPTLTCLVALIVRKRSGFHSSASCPQTEGSLTQGRSSSS